MDAWGSVMFAETFPYNAQNEKAYKGNPAIQLFGNRLFGDQTATEFLVEFLLLTIAQKQIGSATFSTHFPSRDILSQWHDSELKYAPKARLNLKLFSFLAASRLDTRHITHREHYRDLASVLMERIDLTGSGSKDDVVRTLEDLFLGFQGAGAGRTWCAQSFLPAAPGLIAGETIWNETAARRTPPAAWGNITDSLATYLTMNKHRFLARGGEVLYLQICNALRQAPAAVQSWVQANELALDPQEQNPKWLHATLERELDALMTHCPATLTELAEFIDTAIDPQTSAKTDGYEGSERQVSAGWCPAASWQEGYLFAVDLIRLCKANLDVIDRLYLLESACALQVLRSLATQSARCHPRESLVGWPGFRLAFTAPEERRQAVKRISRHTARAIEKQIFQAIRNPNLVLSGGDDDMQKALKEADTRYAGKLFIGLAKRLGLIVPRRGSGARFILNEHLLRLLVFTTVPVGKRLTFDTFKALVERRYGFVFDAVGFVKACKWSEYGSTPYLPNGIDDWLQEMLAAAGLLIRLSDACALVENPAGNDRCEGLE